MIRLVLAGPPLSRHEPHHAGQGRSFADKRTVSGINAWRLRWELAGCPRIDGPVALGIRVVVLRPASHYRADGVTLSATGLRAPLPPRVDVDNVSKLVLDALKGRAFDDDRRIGTLEVRKLWGPVEATSVVITRWHPESLDLPLVLGPADLLPALARGFTPEGLP